MDKHDVRTGMNGGVVGADGMIPASPAPVQPRRRRYAGTHPRRFDERYKELDPARFPEVREHVLAQGRTPAGTHVPVLMNEVLASLAPRPGDVVADCTIGCGGHAAEFLPRIAPGGRLIGLDVDGDQLERTRARLAMRGMGRNGRSDEAVAPPEPAPAIRLHRCPFTGLPKVLRHAGLEACDIILADLGVSSMQIDDARRGFSYKHDGPLDMRMDDRMTRTAAGVIADLTVDEIERALHSLADEPDADRIARLIADRRRVRPLTTTSQLVQTVFDAKRISPRAWRRRDPEHAGDLHPAARTFQALRMIVNGEVPALEQFLRIAPHCLRAGGRLGIISFHSGEEARVAASFRLGLEQGFFSCASERAVRPAAAERRANPRSASARFHWAVRATAV